MNILFKYKVSIILISLLFVSENAICQFDACTTSNAQTIVYQGDNCNTGNMILVLENQFESKWDKTINTVIGFPWTARAWSLSTNYSYSSNNNFLIIGKNEPLTNQCFTFWEGTVGNHMDCDFNITYVPVPDMVTICRDFQYTAGKITSKEKFSYGMFEIRCKLPIGPGFWPAFWLFYDGTTHPIYNELDIFEFTNHDNQTQYMTVHVDIDGDNNAINHPESCASVAIGPDYSLSQHTFTCIWDKDKIIWLVDNVIKRTYYKYPCWRASPDACKSIT